MIYTSDILSSPPKQVKLGRRTLCRHCQSRATVRETTSTGKLSIKRRKGEIASRIPQKQMSKKWQRKMN